MVWLLRNEARWLVELLVERRFLPREPYALELLPTETWPVGEENRGREIRADVVLRLWPGRVVVEPSLKMIRASHVIGLILDFQERREPAKELRVLEYDSAYPPVVGSQVYMVVMTFREPIARWMQRVFRRKQLSMQTCVLLPRQIPRSGAIDVDTQPRRALLEAMLHVRSKDDLPLLTDALRALRQFEGNELVIYREMLRSKMDEKLIIQAYEELEAEDDEAEDARWADYVCDEEERNCFYYRQGERAGIAEGLAEGLAEGQQKGLALAVLDVLRIRKIEIDTSSEDTIVASHDETQLRAWLARATVVGHIRELFEPG